MASAPSKSTYVINARGHQLRADAAASYLRMLAAGLPAGGVDVFRRTMAQQQALYDAYRAGRGPIAAKPSPTAPHIDGRAMDLQTTRGGVYTPSAAHRWLTAGGDGSSKPKAGEKLRAHEYGWRRSVPSERWHFEYDRARDTKRAADLAARLKALDYANVQALQRAHGLTVDGIDGPQTWSVLLTAKPAPKPAPAPAPIPVPKPTPPAPAPAPAGVDFRIASYNAQLAHFGGGPAAADAAFVRDVLKPSILLAQEVDEGQRTAILAETGMTKTYPLGSVALLWDDGKWRHGPRFQVALGTSYHGMVGCEVVSAVNGSRMVIASVHVRPNDAIKGSYAQKLAGKLADVRKIITALAKYPNVVVGGDWSTEAARAVLVEAGYRLVAPWADTYDKAGVQRLDAIYTRGPLLVARTAGSVHATAASDHHGIVANLTLKPTPAPTN